MANNGSRGSQRRAGGQHTGRRRERPAPGRSKRRKGLIPTIKYSLTRLGNKLIRSPLVPIIGGLILLGLLLFAGIWLLTNKNAYDVYVGDEVVASIARSKDITDKWIYDNALAKLSADLGTKVQVEPEVSITPVHKSSKKLSSDEYAIGAVYKAFLDAGYKIEAAEIHVNGVAIALVRSEAEANSVLDQVMLSYAPVGVTVVEKGFVDDTVEVVPRFADSSEIESAERAFAKLTVKTEVESIYQVRTGDSVWQICRELGITQDKLVELNPDVPEVASGNLRAGQIIKVVKPKPICSVRTVEEITYTDVESRTVEERPNNTQPKSYTKTIQQGRDGSREVLAHLERINGVEEDREVISYTTLVAPVVEIIEVGTL